MVTVAALAASPAAAQGDSPRTPWGAPDLQGIWDFRTITPMERPEELGDRAFLTAEEAANLEQATLDRNEQLLQAEARRTEAGGNVGAYNNFWMDRGTRTVSNRRTSLIVDPPNGRIPPVTADGQARKDAVAVRRGRPAFGPEDRSIGERCLLGFNAGPPMEPRAYNNHAQLFQTPDHVVILNEMVNDARIIPLDGRAHLPGDVTQWRGDSRARWEDDTLVVETRNFHTDTAFSERQGSSPGMVLTERFTRVDDETLLYAATMDDASTWTQPWTFEVTMFRTEEPVYEYACHEGNIGMDGILAGARADDARAAQQ
jgi:hypothetical protein